MNELLKKQKVLPALLAATLGCAAQSAGDGILGLGMRPIDPKPDNGTLPGAAFPLSIGSDANRIDPLVQGAAYFPRF